MVSIIAEQPITLIEACQTFPGRPHKNTVKRWMFSGVRGIKLRHFRCGQTICTTRAAIDEFLLATNPGFVNSPSANSEGHREAEEQLAAMGV